MNVGLNRYKNPSTKTQDVLYYFYTAKGIYKDSKYEITTTDNEYILKYNDRLLAAFTQDFKQLKNLHFQFLQKVYLN